MQNFYSVKVKLVSEHQSRRANPNKKNHENETPLSLCVENMFEEYYSLQDQNNFLQHYEALLAHGANPNLHDRWGKEPIFTAVIWNNPAALKLLLAYNADHSPRDPEGDTPLHLAATAGLIELVQLLLPKKQTLVKQ